MGQNQSSPTEAVPQSEPHSLMMDGEPVPLEVVENVQDPEAPEAPAPVSFKDKVLQHKYVTAATSHKHFKTITIIIIAIILVLVLVIGLAVGLREESSSSSSSPSPSTTTQGFPVLTSEEFLSVPEDEFGILEASFEFQTSANQTAILKIFQQAVENPPYLQWYGEDPCDGWTGITCTGDKKIIGFEYDNSPDIATSIPPEFSELSDLTTLILNNDGITGTIPPELSVLDMQNFQVLNHKMNGTLPSDFSTWTSIQTFELSATDSTGSIAGTLPVELSTWSNLVSFGMENNFLTGELPVEYTAWRSASIIKLSNNAFTGSVPEEFLEWGDLSFLSISPQIAGGLCLTQTLSEFLAGTNITVNIFGLPDCITSVEKAALVKFRDSVQDRTLLESWSGPDPCATWTGVTCSNGTVTGLEYARQSTAVDAVTSIPPEFSQLENLNSLILNNDGITGSIPIELSILDMQEFQIGNHSMEGTLPSQLSAWKNLRIFNLNAGPTGVISGPLPVQYSAWKNLDTFNMVNNDLTGFLPGQYSLWRGAREILLRSNSLGGTVPASYSQLQSLEQLFLGNQTRDRLCITDSLKLYLTQEVATEDLDDIRLC